MNVFRIAAAVISLCALTASAEPQDALKPLLTDLKGWSAEAAEGTNVNMMGMSMVNAVRSYEKDGTEATAMIMVGTSTMMQGQLASAKVENDEVQAVIEKRKGFETVRAESKEDGSGYVMVTLVAGDVKSATFMFSFDGIGLDEGLQLAETFDWAAMKKAAAPLVK